MWLLLTLGLAVVTLLSVNLQRAYAHVPARELKRRARAGDPLAEALHRAAAYGFSLRLLLWIITAAAAALFFVIISRALPLGLAAMGCAGVLLLGFVWLPLTPVTRFTMSLAARLAPVFAWTLRYLHPVLEPLGRLLKRVRRVHVHSRMYEKEDLLALIEQQQKQSDNRITRAELELAAQALTLGDKLIRERQTPRRAVKAVAAGDTIGPVLLDELHASHHSCFPVYEGDPEAIVGILYLNDAVNAKAGGQVKSIMKPTVYYLNEQQPLYDVLQAGFKTKQQLFVVVNNLEEYTGIITISDVLGELVGQPAIDDFDGYDDRRAVAARAAPAQPEAVAGDQVEPQTFDEVIELGDDENTGQ